MARRLVWVALAAASAYAIFVGGSWFGIYQPGLRVMSVVLAAVVLAGWAAVAWRDPAWRPRSALLPAIGACLASLAISSVFSRNPGISLEYLAYAVLLAALYLLLVQLLRRDFFRRRFITFSSALFIAIVGVYLALTVSHWVAWLSALGRFTIPPLRPEFESLTFGNPSTVLTIVALLAVPIVGTVSWTSRRGSAAAVAVLGLVAVVALVSGSRAGWLALAAAGVGAIFGAAVSPDARAIARSHLARRLETNGGRAVVVVAMAGIVLVAAALAPAIIRRATEGGEALRLTFVRIALELFGQSPIVGTGPGTWVIQRPGLTLPGDVDDYIPHAHNVYAQTLGELGLLGAAAGLVLTFLLVRLVLGAARDPNVAQRRLGWAVLIGLVYFAAHQVLDFYPNFPAVLIAAAIPAALLDAATAGVVADAPARDTPPERPTGPLGRLRGAPLLAATVGLAAALVLLAAQELPALDAARAVDRANSGDWAGADGPARAAAATDPRIASYRFTAGLAAAHAGDHVAAADYFRSVVARDDLPEAWLNLAAEQAELGDEAGATDSLIAAFRIGRQRPAVAMPIGELALRLGERELAVEALTAAVLTAPSILADPWWTLDPGRQAVRLEVAQAANASSFAYIQWEIALMTGDVATARTLATTPGLDPSTVDFVDAWAGDEAAHQRLSARCHADPRALQALFWCARIEGRRGNVDEANAYRYLANAQIGGAYRNGAELRVATRPMVGRTLEGNPAIFWGTYTYRRPTPWDVLVPSLVHLTIE